MWPLLLYIHYILSYINLKLFGSYGIATPVSSFVLCSTSCREWLPNTYFFLMWCTRLMRYSVSCKSISMNYSCHSVANENSNLVFFKKKMCEKSHLREHWRKVTIEWKNFKSFKWDLLNGSFRKTSVCFDLLTYSSGVADISTVNIDILSFSLCSPLV